MVFRVSIANLSAEQVAQIGQSLNMAGTAFVGLAFGKWGVEPTVVAELGGITRNEVSPFRGGDLRSSAS
jgi:hypothetical protein